MKSSSPLGQKGRKKRYYQYTAIDDCTRLRVLRAYPRNDQSTAIAFIDHLLSKLPCAVDQVQTDIQSGWATNPVFRVDGRGGSEVVRHLPVNVA